MKTKCKRCGKATGTDTVHTCSPQAPAPSGSTVEILNALENLTNAIDMCKGHGTPIFRDRAIAYFVIGEAEKILKANGR